MGETIKVSLEAKMTGTVHWDLPYEKEIVGYEDVLVGYRKKIIDTIPKEPINLDDKHIDMEYYTVIKNNKFEVYLSVNISNEDPLMIKFIHHREQRPYYWTIEDTRAMAFPYNHLMFNPIEGMHMLMKNHPTINDGVTLALREALNLWDFAEDYGKNMDIKSLKLKDGQFVYNSVHLPLLDYYKEDIEYHRIKQPIVSTIDTGFVDVSSHINKRFHKFNFETYNVDGNNLPIYVEFSVDDVPRQTSEQIKVVQSGSGEVTQVHEFNPIETYSRTQTNFWELDSSVLDNRKKHKIDIGISGKGRLARMVLSFRSTGKFRLYRYGLVFKEHSAR